MHALLIAPFDDESSILSLILQRAGFTVQLNKDLARLSSSWPEVPLDFVLMALNEFNDRILKTIREIRQQSAVPFLLIVDSLSESDQVDQLDAGVDYLIIRPYGIRYLGAVIKSLMRRVQGTSLFNLPILAQSDVKLDPSARMVTVGEGEPVRLTHLEFRLLHTLITNPGQVIPTDNLVEYVWGYSGTGDRDLVRGLVQRLRTKVELDPRHPKYIITHSGLGYAFQPQV